MMVLAEQPLHTQQSTTALSLEEMVCPCPVPAFDFDVVDRRDASLMKAVLQFNRQLQTLLKASKASHSRCSSMLVVKTEQLLQKLFPQEKLASSHAQIAPLRTFLVNFIVESRTTFSTLLLATLYLHRFHQQKKPRHNPVLYCSRRMFLVALMLAHKYLHEPCPSNQSWSKLSRLPLNDLATMERLFLQFIHHDLHVAEDEFALWTCWLLNTFDFVMHCNE